MIGCDDRQAQRYPVGPHSSSTLLGPTSTCPLGHHRGNGLITHSMWETEAVGQRHGESDWRET